jgi:hypothetical protein
MEFVPGELMLFMLRPEAAVPEFADGDSCGTDGPEPLTGKMAPGPALSPSR